MTVTIDGTNGITSSGDLTLNNGTADGAQVTLTSSGYSNWNLDNYSGRFRAYYNATECFTVTNSGNVRVGSSDTSLGSINSVNTFGFKNRIINGAMMIDQRNAGASVSVTASNAFITDRFNFTVIAGSPAMTGQQVTDAPANYKNSFKATTTVAATSLTGTNRAVLQQNIEGLNVADLGWGTVTASTVTLSFWVKSSLTGTFGGALENSDYTRSYPFTYTISSANTWEQKSVTIAGDTTGTWLTTNGIGIQVVFGLGVASGLSGTAGAWAGADYRSATGAVSVLNTLNATWQVTGVQLEKGSTATSFDYRPYGTELALCQRYFYQPIQNTSSGTAQGGVFTWVITGDTTTAISNNQFPVPMRATPTVTIYNNGGTSGGVQVGGVGDTTGVTAVRINSAGCNGINKGSALGTQGNVCMGLPVVNAEL